MSLLLVSLILTHAHSWFSISQPHPWGSDSLDSKQNRAMAWAPDWLITIIRDRLVDRGILDSTFFLVKNLEFSSVWIDSSTSWQVRLDTKHVWLLFLNEMCRKTTAILTDMAFINEVSNPSCCARGKVVTPMPSVLKINITLASSTRVLFPLCSESGPIPEFGRQRQRIYFQ